MWRSQKSFWNASGKIDRNQGSDIGKQDAVPEEQLGSSRSDSPPVRSERWSIWLNPWADNTNARKKNTTPKGSLCAARNSLWTQKAANRNKTAVSCNRTRVNRRKTAVNRCRPGGGEWDIHLWRTGHRCQAGCIIGAREC